MKKQSKEIVSFAKVVANKNYKDLVSSIGELLAESRRRALQTVNEALVRTYWNIGRHIVEFEQKGNVRASYGDQLLVRLSKDLTVAYGKGFSRSNLFMIRQFYVRFPKFQTVSGKLSWSHYAEILKSDSELEIGFYAKQCELEKSKNGIQLQKPEDIVSRYQLYLPNRDELQRELEKLLGAEMDTES